MRRTLIGAAAIGALAVGLACQGGGNSEPDDPTKGPSLDSCGNVVHDAALAAPASDDDCTTAPQSDESS